MQPVSACGHPRVLVGAMAPPLRKPSAPAMHHTTTNKHHTTNMLLRSGNVTGVVHASFSLDGETWFAGLYCPAVDWNGFPVPSFTRDVWEQLLEHIADINRASGHHFHHAVLADGTFHLFDRAPDVYDDPAVPDVVAEPFDIGGHKNLYCDGGGWTWEVDA